MIVYSITDIAIRHFARKGYEGASLAEISSEAGIKKQSLYAHFTGKDEMFITALRTVIQRDLYFIEGFFNRNRTVPVDIKLKGLLDAIASQFSKDDDVRLLLRMSFFPPAHLEQQVFSLCSEHTAKTYEFILPVFKWAESEKVIDKKTEINVAVEGYMALMDCVFFEMLYGKNDYPQKRIDALWSLYWKGLTQ